MILSSPIIGAGFTPDTPHSLLDDEGERWPVIDGIPYLRVGSRDRANAALRFLDAGDQDSALVLLLAENDDWWDEPPPPEAQLRRLLAERDTLSLREAMELLGWGRVGTYFAHRWTDPTYLAGLALLDAHWCAPQRVFELACGIGHYLREFGRAGVAACGADIVFAKLWVAKHWVAPEAELICFDAEADWPMLPPADLAYCHDAFYFLRDKARAAAGLRAVAPNIAMAHIHNGDWPNYSSGAAMTLAELRALFPEAKLYADEALTEAARTGSTPNAGDVDNTEAFALVEGPLAAVARPAAGPLGLPPAGQLLRRNPLLDGAWPSERYRQEYGRRATWGDRRVPAMAALSTETLAAARARDLVDLPERW